MLIIPNLCELPFHRIDASLSLPLDQLTLSDHETYAPFETAIMARINGERAVFATLETTPEMDNAGELRAFLTVSFEDPPPSPTLSEIGWGQDWGFSLQEWEQADQDAIWNTLAIFSGKSVNLFVKATFLVDRDDVPSDSLVSSMIGLRTKAGEEQFVLSGAQLAVRGFPDDTVAWYLKPGSNGQKIAGEVTRYWMEKFRPESINNAVYVIEARFNRVFKVPSSLRHATA